VNGKLIVGSMPLGNMEDITLRMLDAFKTADIILSDYPTTYADALMKKYDIDKNLIILKSFHSCHADGEQVEFAMSAIEDGKRVLLISSEGQIALSDPGIQFIQECIRRGLPYQVLPGPNAGVHAYISSGLSNGKLLVHPTIEPKNVNIEFTPLKNIPSSLTVYIWGKDIPEIIDQIDKDYKWESEDEQFANRMISLCCNLTTQEEFIITDWAHKIKSHPDLKKIHQRTKVTVVIGELMHTEDCDHHICNSIRDLFPGQKYKGAPQKPIDKSKPWCDHPGQSQTPWVYN
jgi:siroheme synthase